jgi:hypothetical protein
MGIPVIGIPLEDSRKDSQRGIPWKFTERCKKAVVNQCQLIFL